MKFRRCSNVHKIVCVCPYHYRSSIRVMNNINANHPYTAKRHNNFQYADINVISFDTVHETLAPNACLREIEFEFHDTSMILFITKNLQKIIPPFITLILPTGCSFDKTRLHDMQFVGRFGQYRQADNCPAAVENLYSCTHCRVVNSVGSQQFLIRSVLLLSYINCMKSFDANMAWNYGKKKVVVEPDANEIDALHKSYAKYEASKKHFIAAFQPIIW